MHISHGHSQNWNSMICKLAKWISSKQVIGVCHQSLAASNRIPCRKSIKNPPLHSSIFQLILSSGGMGGGGRYWISGLQRGNQNPGFIFWFSWIPGEAHWSLTLGKHWDQGICSQVELTVYESAKLRCQKCFYLLKSFSGFGKNLAAWRWGAQKPISFFCSE